MNIRPIAIAVIRRGQELLVSQGYDPARQLTFYRPLGGGIEFGEKSEAALIRELQEEISADIHQLQYLGMLENIFEFDGKPHHEIVLVYEAKFLNETLYSREEFDGIEYESGPFKAYWKPLSEFTSPQAPPLFPAGLVDMLQNYWPASNTGLPDFDALWNYSQPAETEKKFRQLLPIALSSENNDYYLQLLTQIARTQGLQRQFDAAHETLDQVSRQLVHISSRTLIRYLLERGRVYNSSRQPEIAKPIFIEALTIARNANEDAPAIDAAHMLGIADLPDRQIAWNEQALLIAEQSTDKQARKWLGSLYNNMGWTYHDLAQYDNALEMFFKSLLWREQQGDKQGAFIARWCIGRTYRSKKMFKEALAIHELLLYEIEHENLPVDGYVHEEMGENLFALQQPESAKIHFAEAHRLLSGDQWLAEKEPERLQRLYDLSK